MMASSSSAHTVTINTSTAHTLNPCESGGSLGGEIIWACFSCRQRKLQRPGEGAAPHSTASSVRVGYFQLLNRTAVTKVEDIVSWKVSHPSVSHDPYVFFIRKKGMNTANVSPLSLFSLIFTKGWVPKSSGNQAPVPTWPVATGLNHNPDSSGSFRCLSSAVTIICWIYF